MTGRKQSAPPRGTKREGNQVGKTRGGYPPHGPRSKNRTAPANSGARRVRKYATRVPLDSKVQAGGNITRPFGHSNKNGPLVGKRSGAAVARQYGLNRPKLTITKY